MQEKTVIGYCDPFSAEAGETVRFMVSTYAAGDYHADLVRIISGDDSEGGPGIIEEDVACDFTGSYSGRHQSIHPGSRGMIDQGQPLADHMQVTLAAWVWPTLPGRVSQTILGTWDGSGPGGCRLFLNEAGALAFQAGDGNGKVVAADTGLPLTPRQWYRVSASFDAATGMLQLSQQAHCLSPGQGMRSGDARREFSLNALSHIGSGNARVSIAAHITKGLGTDHYNGKIDRPRMAARALNDSEVDTLLGAAPMPELGDDLIGHWDLSRGISTDRIEDLGPNRRHGFLVNLPARAMTGHNWTGQFQDWKQKPDQYGAIHFHDDDLYDAGWSSDFEFHVPADLPSGVYAARISLSTCVDRIPFVVRPRIGTATAEVAFLMPTASYLAYADYKLRLKANPIFGDGMPENSNDAFLALHPELGNSTYDLHSDRSGVAYSSRLRPVTNMKPGDNRPWGFPADCNILSWLNQIGQPFDVITDEDLHRHGQDLLRPYRAVITGSHPEYHSTEMLDGIEGWLEDGGRLMYLGGNGFYWRVGFRDDLPGALEVRRAEDGTRAWIAEPGEYYQSFNGEYGGLWRRIGRAPNRLVGVGFAAQGFDKSGHYRRASGADNPRAAFIFEGIGDEVLGDFGSIGGGAAGEEIDRHDVRLGSPQHALIVATSEGLGQDMLRTKEEFLSTIPWFDDPKVRADMTFFECPNGGAVFSTGSIAYAASLSHNNYDNNIAKLTANVVRRFADPTPFTLPDGEG